MASTIQYKYRSGTHFETLPLPGSAARLFDVKRAIVKAKKLDASGSLEFDLSIRNADTDEEYADESVLLPRGTRVVVERRPAAKGHGFLTRMARVDAGMGGMPTALGAANLTAVPHSLYNIESRGDDQDEFVSSITKQQQNNSSMMNHDEEKELADLKAVTETANAVVSSATAGGLRPGGAFRNNSRPPGGGPPQAGGAGGANPQGRGGGGGANSNYQGRSFHQRPNADPELREQENKLLPKKRATGIPRTFLNLKPGADSAKPSDGSDPSALETPMLQPNVLGFEELKSRGGGQSENASGTKLDLDYALKLTGMTIPEELQCGICHGVVKNAMLLLWDSEGPAVCESCIRDALAQNGFRCPLTGMEGVSPDDIHPNNTLRKSAERFINEVMEKMEEIDQQQVEEDVVQEDTTGAKPNGAASLLEGDRDDSGVIVSKKLAQSKRRKADDDPFGGDEDDFGGDVFAVEAEAKMDEDEEQPQQQQQQQRATEEKMQQDAKDAQVTDESTMMDEHGTPNQENKTVNPDPHKHNESSNNNKNSNDSNKHRDGDDSTVDRNAVPPHQDDHSGTPERHDNVGRRDMRRRGPPVGYAMGPAGGAAVHATVNAPPVVRGGGGPFHGHPGRAEWHDGHNGGGPIVAVGDPPQPYFGGRGRSPYARGEWGGRFFPDRPPFRARGRRGGGRFPGRFGGGRYNDWQQGGGGGGGRWGGADYQQQQQMPVDRTHEEHSIRDDVSLPLNDANHVTKVDSVKRQKQNSWMNEDSLDCSNKIVATVPCCISHSDDCLFHPFQEATHYSHEGGGGGADDESRGTKRSRAHSEDLGGGDEEHHQPTTSDDQHSSGHRSRHHHRHHDDDEEDGDDHHSKSRHRHDHTEEDNESRHHHRDATDHESESRRRRDSNEMESGSHRRRDSNDHDSTSRHHHDSEQDSESRHRHDAHSSGSRHHHSDNGQQVSASANRYHQHDNGSDSVQSGSPYQQQGGYPGRYPSGPWSPRAEAGGGRYDANWNRGGGGGGRPPFRGGFRGRRGGGFRGGRFPRAPRY